MVCIRSWYRFQSTIVFMYIHFQIERVNQLMAAILNCLMQGYWWKDAVTCWLSKQWQNNNAISLQVLMTILLIYAIRVVIENFSNELRLSGLLGDFEASAFNISLWTWQMFMDEKLCLIPILIQNCKLLCCGLIVTEHQPWLPPYHISKTSHV